MTTSEQQELGQLAVQLSEAAARLPVDSQWRGRLVQEARLFRSVAGLPTFEVLTGAPTEPISPIGGISR